MATNKHANGEGSIRKRPDGRWEARFHLPDGKRKSIYGETRQEVARRLAAARRDRDKGIPIVGEKQTVGQFLIHWLEIAKPTIRPSTWIRYAEYINLHTIPTLGKVPLARLSPQQVQALYADKLAAGLSPTTVHHLHAVLHRALDQAMRWGLVVRNVCELVDAPRMAEHEMAVLAPSQARTLIEAARGDRFEALYILAVTTGMRLGELLALKWHDVDLDRAVLHVVGSLQRTEAGTAIGMPKTAKSRRTVALTAMATAALRQHRLRQLEERLRLGLAGSQEADLDLVFPNTVGKAMAATHMARREFYPLLARAGLPRIRFHDLRHTAATLMLLEHIPAKVVSEMLGHSTIAITLDLYSHVLPDMQKEATAAVD